MLIFLRGTNGIFLRIELTCAESDVSTAQVPGVLHTCRCGPGAQVSVRSDNRGGRGVQLCPGATRGNGPVHHVGTRSSPLAHPTSWPTCPATATYKWAPNITELCARHLKIPASMAEGPKRNSLPYWSFSDANPENPSSEIAYIKGNVDAVGLRR